MFLQFLQCLIFPPVILSADFNVSLEPHSTLGNVEYPQSSMTSGDKRDNEPLVRTYRDTLMIEENLGPPGSRDSFGNSSLNHETSKTVKNVTSENSRNNSVSASIFVNSSGNNDLKNLSTVQNKTIDRNASEKSFNSEKFVPSKESVDKDEKPNFRLLENDDRLKGLSTLEKKNVDEEISKKIRSNETIGVTNFSNFSGSPNDQLKGFSTLEKKNFDDEILKKISSNETIGVTNSSDFSDSPNNQLKGLSTLEMKNVDVEILRKIISNETVAVTNSDDLSSSPEDRVEETTIAETTTLSAKHETVTPSSNEKKSTRRRKGKRKSGKKRIGKKSKKSKDEFQVSRERSVDRDTRRSKGSVHPIVYSEKPKIITDKKTKKYQGIDRKPTGRPLLRHLRTKPEMEFLRYDTTIRSRYARTTVTGRVKNYGQTRDLNVNVIFPRIALITKFETTVNGKTIAATVGNINGPIDRTKSVVNGINVGTILVETRDCDAVAVAVTVPSDSTLNYTVTYEYLLERNLGVYTVPITVHNNMWINDLTVRWRIQEERNLTSLKMPLIHATTALSLDHTDDPTVCITNDEPGIAELIWRPTISEQKNISLGLGKLSKNGVVGVLELKYDVSHDQDPCGQVVRQGGYFAQFFAPPNQPPLTKHVVFILDVSDSMQGNPIKQLKTAMNYILDTLQPMDNFTLINFSDEVNIMNIYDRARDTIYRGVGIGPDGRGEKSGKTSWPGNLETYEATASNIEAAKKAVKIMDLRVFTNIYDALVMGFKSVEDMAALPPAQTGQSHPEPFIVFLTDGHASDGPSYDNDVILKMVEDQNHNTKATMFALGFGGEADMGLLRRFALATNGIEKHIYKDIDAADQLVTFFQSIKAPVLKDVYFKYSSKQVITATLTGQSFPMIHRGKEVTIAGKLDPAYPDKSNFYVDVTALGRYAMIRCERTAEKSRKSLGDRNVVIKYSNATATSRHMLGTRSNRSTSAGTVERIWAFKTLSRLRDEIDLDHSDTHQDTRCDDALEPRERMLEICLRLNYAMPTVTNLVYNDTVIERVSVSPERGDQIEETKQYDPLAQYPWILKLRDKQGFAKLPITNRRKGRMYTYLSLGINENPPPPRSCADGIDGSPGECRYLPECPDPRVLGSPEKFRKHFCRLGSYAGVCCSDTVPRTAKPNR